MRLQSTTVLCMLALFVVVVTPRDVQAQAPQTEPSAVDENAEVGTDLDEIEEIIVRGRSFGDLRLEIRRSEEALFTLFNELNSTDDFDINCSVEKYDHMRARSCMANFARELQGKAATAVVRAMQDGAPGNSATLVQFYLAEARRLQRLMNAEMRQLAAEHGQLEEAVVELSQAQLALTLARGKTTLSRQVTATLGSLPYDAELMFEIIMGVQPFRHQLTQSTFTIADVSGEIRGLEVDCAEGRKRIDYERGVDWTVPSGWSSCQLEVGAKRGTTFRLYEF